MKPLDKFKKAKAVALKRTAARGGREARIERDVSGYIPQVHVVTVEVYRSAGDLTRTRIAVGTVNDLSNAD